MEIRLGLGFFFVLFFAKGFFCFVRKQTDLVAEQSFWMEFVCFSDSDVDVM